MVIVLKVSFSFPTVKSILLVLANSTGQPPELQWLRCRPWKTEVRLETSCAPAPAEVTVLTAAALKHSVSRDWNHPATRQVLIKCLLRENSNTPPLDTSRGLSCLPSKQHHWGSRGCRRVVSYPNIQVTSQSARAAEGRWPQARPQWAAGKGAARHFGSSDWNRCSVSILPKSSCIVGHTHATGTRQRPSPPRTLSRHQVETEMEQEWSTHLTYPHTQ